MAAVDDDVQKGGFTFVWTIQNFSYCVETSLESPIFKMSEKEYDEWCLVLYPKGIDDSDTIALNLCLKIKAFRVKKEVSFELSICTPMGIYKQEEGHKNVFERYVCSFGFNSTIRQKDLKIYKSCVYIDSVTVRCRI